MNDPEWEGLNVDDQLNLQTAKIEWSELERHFARGVLILVEKDIDLISVGLSFTKDGVDSVQQLKTLGQLRHVTVDDAKAWQPENSVFWAVVVSPWVLIQQADDSTG